MQDIQKPHLQPKEDVYDESKVVPLKTHNKKSRDKLNKQKKPTTKVTESKKSDS